MSEMRVTITEGLECPKCGAQEVENQRAPISEWVFNIRAYRVCDSKGVWWSQCLVCAAGETGVHNPKEGWFK